MSQANPGEGPEPMDEGHDDVSIVSSDRPPVVGWIPKIPTPPIVRMDGQNAAMRTVTHTSTNSTLSRHVGTINPT